MTLKRVVIAMIATLALGGVSAFAVHLSVTTRTLGAGTTVVARCDPNAATNWTYAFTKNSSGQVTNVTVGNIASECINGDLSLTTTDSSGGNVSGSSSPIPVTSSSVNVPMSNAEYPANLTRIHVVVAGP